MASFEHLHFEPLSHLDSIEGRIEEELAVLEEEIEDILHIPHSTPTIDNGHLLPTPVRRRIKPQLTGVALKEVSTKYKKKDTFVVIGRGSRILYRFGDAAHHSKMHEGGWRGQAIAILTHGVFNYFMVAAVLLNCILLATIPYEPTAPSSPASPEEKGVDGPPASKSESTGYGIIGKVNCYGFLILYILEFALKVAARGLYRKRNPFSCLRISWSWLDIFVITVGILTVAVPSNRTLAALNGFRILKLISLIPSFLGGYDRMFRRTWKRLLRVGVFAAVVFFLLGLIACEMFFNTLRQKCVLNSTAVESYKSGEPLKKESFLLNPRGEAYYLPCGNSSMSEVCPADYVCLVVGENPQGGLVGFDSFPLSEFSLLNVLFQDYAEFVYEEIWAIHGPFHIIYFIFVFLFGTFSIGALVYAVLGYEFNKGYVETLALEQGSEKHRKRGSTDFETVFHVADANILEKIRENGKKLVKHDYFHMVITLFIILDMVNYGLDHYGIEQNTPLWTFFYVVNQVVYVVYCLEFLLKVAFLGVKAYWKKPWNRFDFFVVVLIVIQSFLEGGLMSYRITTSVLKIVPRWPALSLMLTIMIKTIWIWFRWAFALYCLVFFIFAYMGYVAFGNAYSENADVFPNSEIPRWNMLDYGHAKRVIFRAFCGEWIETTWDLLMVAPGPGGLSLMVASGIIGNFLETCLGVGILLTTSTYISQSESSEEGDRKPTSLERIFSPCSLLCAKVKSWMSSEDGEAPEVEKGEPSFTAVNPATEDEMLAEVIKAEEELLVEEIKVEEKLLNGEDAEIDGDAKGQGADGDKEGAKGQGSESKGEKFRAVLTKILDHVAYRTFACFLIILVSILLMYWEFPTEIFFVCYFGIEFILRVVAIAFNRKLFNVGLSFDMLMIFNSILALALDWPQGVAYLGSFRLFMLVSRIPGLVIVRGQFRKQLCAVSQYLLSTLFIWYAFSLGGMSLFSGKFAKCVENGKAVSTDDISDKAECLEAGKTWDNDTQYNFDSVPNSFITLVTVATRNGWVHAIASAEDANGRDMQPGKEASPAAMLYFSAFLLIGVLYPLYIILGVILTILKKKTWVDLFRKEDSKDQGKTEGGSKKDKTQTSISDDSFLSKYVINDYFELCVCLVILIDSIAVAVQFSTDEEVDPAGFEGLWIFRICVLVLYVVEFVLRGLSLKLSFFKQWLNDLLLVVIIVSIVEFAVDDLGDAVNYFLILRTFRLLNILALDKVGPWPLPEFKSFRNAICSSFSSLSYIFLFYAIAFSCYTVFGSLAFDGIVDFTSWKAMTSLFKIATISGWEGIWERISVGGDCKDDSDGDCGQPILGFFYADTFILLTVATFVNAYFVVAMEIVEQLKKCEEPVKGKGAKCSKKKKPTNEAIVIIEAVE